MAEMPERDNGSNTGQKVGPYELGPTIGKGKFGKVKAAVNLETGQRVAIKIVLKALVRGNNDEVTKEVRCLRAIRHPNVVELYECLDDEDRVYLVMELAKGGDLFGLIMDQPDSRFVEADARVYFLQLMEGLRACHEQGIAHRDMKPENLLLTEESKLLISDFGLSNWFQNPQMPGVERLLATPCGSTKYAAPEIFWGDYNAKAIDVWSSGVVLYIMAAGQFPWTQATPRCGIYLSYANGEWRQDPKPPGIQFEWPPWFSPELVELLVGMLNPDPAARWTVPQVLVCAWCTAGEAMAMPVDECKPEEALGFDECMAAGHSAQLLAPAGAMMEEEGSSFTMKEPASKRAKTPDASQERESSAEEELRRSSERPPEALASEVAMAGDDREESPSPQDRSADLDMDQFVEVPVHRSAEPAGEEVPAWDTLIAKLELDHQDLQRDGSPEVVDVEQRLHTIQLKQVGGAVDSPDRASPSPPCGDSLQPARSMSWSTEVAKKSSMIIPLPPAEAIERLKATLVGLAQELMPGVEFTISPHDHHSNKISCVARYGKEVCSSCALFEPCEDPPGSTLVSFQRRGGCQIGYLKMVKALKAHLRPRELLKANRSSPM